MKLRDVLRLNPLYILMFLFILFLGGVLSYIKIIDSNLKNEILNQKSMLSKIKKEYEKTIYIEDNIKTFYDFINNAREFENIDMYRLKKEFSFLIPNTVLIEETELSTREGKLIGRTIDFRTVDLLTNTLKTYSELYGVISNIRLMNSSKTSPSNVNFQISFDINSSKLIDRIFTNDMDGDGIQDYDSIMVNISGGIQQNKKVINDHCPFTPNNFVVTGRMLEQNPLLIDFYPKYKQMYNDGYFSLKENGCLLKGDFNILTGKITGS